MGKASSARRCPRCGGNLYLDKDYHGWYEECLQCAFMRDLVEIARLKDNTRVKA
ncbi:MAG TPA: hypothetical protein VJ377_10725 [Dehalococcoidales bacterium]|nr:hypothetical protein [Dehalococcoidales bacterium]